MTKPEFTFMRRLAFSKWIRENLPDSTPTGGAFIQTDLDHIFYNYRDFNLMLAEAKQGNQELGFAQENIFNKIDSALKIGFERFNFRKKTPQGIIFDKIKYKGFKKIGYITQDDDEIKKLIEAIKFYSEKLYKLETIVKFYLNNKEISEEELIKILSFKKERLG